MFRYVFEDSVEVTAPAKEVYRFFEDMDRNYLKTRTFWTDVIIMLRTPLVVLSGEGAY